MVEEDGGRAEADRASERERSSDRCAIAVLPNMLVMVTIVKRR